MYFSLRVMLLCVFEAPASRFVLVFLPEKRWSFVDKSPKVYTQLAREGVVLTQDSDNI